MGGQIYSARVDFSLSVCYTLWQAHPENQCMIVPCQQLRRQGNMSRCSTFYIFTSELNYYINKSYAFFSSTLIDSALREPVADFGAESSSSPSTTS